MNNRDETERYVAVDYGTKRIGIAVSDPLMMFATPLGTLENDGNFWKNFKELLRNYKIKLFVVGYPLKEDGTKTILTDEVEKFAKALEKKFGKKVVFTDERYSSSIAEQQIIETVSSRKKRRDKALVDKKAAAVILQSYLDEKSN